MFKINLFTNLFNTLSNLIPYFLFTRIYILDNVEDIIIIRSFLLISVTFLVGGIPTAFNIHQKEIKKEHLYQISLLILSILLGIIFISFNYDFKFIDNLNKLSLLALTFLLLFELSIGYFKSLLRIKVNLQAAIIRFVFVLISINFVISKRIIVRTSSEAFLIPVIIGYSFATIYLLFRSSQLPSNNKRNLKLIKIFKSSIPHYLNVIIQSLISNVDRFVIVLNVLPIVLVDYDYVLLTIGFIFSLSITPVTQLFHPYYMKEKEDLYKGRLVIKNLSEKLFKAQLKLIVPSTLFIYGMVYFGYASSLKPIDLSIILISIFLQSYIMISCSPVYYQEKDYLHTSITIFSALIYLSILPIATEKIGIFGASVSRLIYVLLMLISGFLINKKLKNSILNFKENIFNPIIKVSIPLFILNYFGLKLIYPIIS